MESNPRPSKEWISFHNIVLGILHRLPTGKSAGLSGWTYEHIRAVGLFYERARETLRGFINGNLACAVPHPHLLHTVLQATPCGCIHMWLHGVFVGDWLFVFPLCGFSLSLFCNSVIHMWIYIDIQLFHCDRWTRQCCEPCAISSVCPSSQTCRKWSSTSHTCYTVVHGGMGL